MNKKLGPNLFFEVDMINCNDYHLTTINLLGLIFVYLYWDKMSTQAGLNPDPRRCDVFSSAGPSKIKIRTSSWHKLKLSLCHDEAQILIFDDLC